ncbi:MAG: hypothetical protein HYV07_10165 [Deltaproteobacteria bacterium]|nr:hypothetical protein [Deltaproteobacteria bacterium]
MRSLAFAFASLSLAGSALAEPCGTVTEAGECRGNVVAYCDTTTSELVLFDCVADFDPQSICMTIDAAWGADCALPTAATCLGEDEDGEYVSLFCQGTNPGCLDTLNEQTCVENIGPCTAADEGACNGDRLTYSCSASQPWVIDCATYQGTCVSSQCIGIPEGGVCDDVTLVCAAGLECDASGLCVDPGNLPDASVLSPDAGSVIHPDAAGSSPDAGTPGLIDTGVKTTRPTTTTTNNTASCSCASTLASASASVWPVALLGLVLARRRLRG